MYSIFKGTFKLFLLIFYDFLSSAVADVYSCGGFVKSPNISIDYSKIQVKLLTTEGNLKYETECNPSNGYYMIPVYNKAAYSIRVFAPDGWYFEPEFFDVKVDGRTDPCSLNEDIDFLLSSFAVDGILMSGEGGGPSGVELALSSLEGNVIQTTKTLEGGTYSFRAPPGKYMVSTADGSAQCIERGKVPIEVLVSPVRVAPDLTISGHLFAVRVVSGEKPFAAVLVSLFSQKDVKLSYCNGDPSRNGKKLICAIKTDSSGVAKFPCLPPGSYEVSPSYSNDKARFTFSPKTLELQMGSAQKEVTFDMVGFSGSGRVLMGSLPVANAEILVNSEVKIESDANGWYVLNELQEREYIFTAKKQHYQFDEVKVVLTAENPSIPDLRVKKIEFCGALDIEKTKERIMTVFVTNKRTSDSQAVKTNSAGMFCKFVKPDVYVIAPSKDNGILMMPRQREIDLSREPILDVVFTQFKANILVKASCLAACDEVKMELWNENELIETVVGRDEFRFASVPPDAYTVKILDGGKYCWEQAEIKFMVERSHIDDIIFRQKGYRAQIRVSHPALMKWHLLENKQLGGEIEVTAGTTFFCLPVAGKYNLNFEACYMFEKPLYELDVPQNTQTVVSASLFLITAYVSSESAKEGDFTLDVKGSSAVNTVKALPVSPGKFAFKFYLPLSESGSQLTLSPQSPVYLFEPLSHVFLFNGECHDNEVVFKAIKGVFIEGTLSLAVDKVRVRAKHRSIPNYVLSSFTDIAGNYRLGPVRSLEEFEISAEKEGYKFEVDDKGVFTPIKLSQLRISTVDAISGEPLSDVLLSLSGAQSYRSNNLIDETGKITFVGLHPGEYFVRPILQEYRFEPPSLTINIKEGEEEAVVLKGHQFAFSVFGKVTHMAGQSVQSLVVQAVSEQCNQLQEEDTTDDKGTYRIRGLRPQCVYRLTLKTQNGEIVRSYPTHYDLSVINKHIENIDFVVVKTQKFVDVIGEVDFVGLTSPSEYRIALYKRESLVQRTTVYAPSSIFFFDNLPLDGAEYSVRFETDHGYGGEKYSFSEATFVVDSVFKTVKLKVVSQKLSDVEITMGSYLALPFFLVVAFIFFNHQKAASMVEDAFTRFSAYSVRNHSPSPVDETGDSTRRRIRLRKI